MVALGVYFSAYVTINLRKGLVAANKANELGEVKSDVRHKARAALKKFADTAIEATPTIENPEIPRPHGTLAGR